MIVFSELKPFYMYRACAHVLKDVVINLDVGAFHNPDLKVEA